MIEYLFELSRGLLEEKDFQKPTVAVNITNSLNQFLNEGANIITAHVLAAAQEAWRMNVGRAEKIERILAYYKRGEKRLVLGAFAVDGSDEDSEKNRRGFWLSHNGRMTFHGYPAPDRDKYELHLLPPLAEGARNPVKYYDNENQQ